MTEPPSGKRTDRASRIIRASAAAIYRAFTDPEALAVWLPPTGMKGEVLAFDATPGGTYRMVLTYVAPGPVPRGKTSDNTDVVVARFLELVANERVVQAVDFQSDDPAFAGTMTMTWSLAADAAGTEVVILCENVPEGIGKDDHDKGLASTLENLAAFTETV